MFIFGDLDFLTIISRRKQQILTSDTYSLYQISN